MSKEFNVDFNNLTKKGLVDLCEDYDEKNDDKLSEHFHTVEMDGYTKKNIDPILDENGYIIPMVFEAEDTTVWDDAESDESDDDEEGED